MASRGQVAAAVAESKRKHPDQFCSVPRCLWRTGGGDCPRHKPSPVVEVPRPAAGTRVFYGPKDVGAPVYSGIVRAGRCPLDPTCQLVHVDSDSGVIHHVPADRIRLEASK